MIEIVYDRSEPRLTLRGHAGEGVPGRDIVCAGVSALVYALALQVEAMERQGQVREVHVVLGRGRADIRCKAVEEGPVLAAFDTAAGGLRLISKSYRKNVRFWG